jgi:hypothetical protein
MTDYPFIDTDEEESTETQVTEGFGEICEGQTATKNELRTMTNSESTDEDETRPTEIQRRIEAKRTEKGEGEPTGEDPDGTTDTAHPTEAPRSDSEEETPDNRGFLGRGFEKLRRFL